jgi:glyoxylase-like metal-dependent hydrolase (beta-lactamase superfamily II)
MLRVQELGPVRKFLSARSIFGRAFYHAAAYWVDGLLIDSGCAYTATELSDATASLRLEQIVNTHSHEDHIGANGLLQRRRGAAVLAHRLALPVLANPRLQPLQFYRRLFWGWPERSKGAPVGDWLETEHHRFQIIATPGHSPDHICLYEPERGWLFSGDAFIGGEERAARPDYDIYAIIASLRKLTALPVSRLFPGSGTVRDNPVPAIQRKIEHLERLGAEIRRLHQEGRDIQAIKRQVLGREPSLTYLTLGHFRASHLIKSYLQEPRSATVRTPW